MTRSSYRAWCGVIGRVLPKPAALMREALSETLPVRIATGEIRAYLPVSSRQRNGGRQRILNRQSPSLFHWPTCCTVRYTRGPCNRPRNIGLLLGNQTWRPGGGYSVRFRIGMLLTARRLETLQGSKRGVETIHFAQFWWKIGVEIRHFPHFC